MSAESLLACVVLLPDPPRRWLERLEAPRPRTKERIWNCRAADGGWGWRKAAAASGPGVSCEADVLPEAVAARAQWEEGGNGGGEACPSE